jgi:putative ABC transport system permease protein
MFRHFFITALRNITKSKVISLISLLDFTVGLACAILILLFVLRETSYDRFHKNRDRIYRITTEYIDAFHQSTAPYVLAPTMESNFPEITGISRISYVIADIKKDEDFIGNQYIRSADRAVFSIFTLPFLAGDPQTALDDPFSVVLSSTAAENYFGSRDALGKILVIRVMEEEMNLTVTGLQFPG